MLGTACPVADAVVILAKGDVHAPVTDVFGAPAPAHRLQQRRPWRAGRDEATGAGRDPVSAAAFGLHPDQTGQVTAEADMPPTKLDLCSNTRRPESRPTGR